MLCVLLLLRANTLILTGLTKHAGQRKIPVAGMLTQIMAAGTQQAFKQVGFSALTDEASNRQFVCATSALQSASIIGKDWTAKQRNEMQRAGGVIGQRHRLTTEGLTIGEIRSRERKQKEVLAKEGAGQDEPFDVSDIQGHHRFYRNGLTKSQVNVQNKLALASSRSTPICLDESSDSDVTAPLPAVVTPASGAHVARARTTRKDRA